MGTFMSRLIVAAAFLCLPVTVTWAEDEAPSDLYEMSKAISEGKIDVGKRYDLNEKKGRFDLIHSETIGLECESCHVAKDFAKDYLLVDRYNAARKAAGTGKGDKADVLDRAVCLGCHKTGGVATTWYQNRRQMSESDFLPAGSRLDAPPLPVVIRTRQEAGSTHPSRPLAGERGRGERGQSRSR